MSKSCSRVLPTAAASGTWSSPRLAVDTRPRIEAILGQATALNPTGLVTLERARLLTDVTAPLSLPDDLREAAKLTVYLGRQERAGRGPAFVAVCDLLYRHGIDGATALLGVDGTAHGRRERAAFFSRNAEVPMMVIAVGAGEKIAQVLPELGALLRQPLLTLERVRVCKRDGRRLATPDALPGTDEHGMALWQQRRPPARRDQARQPSPARPATCWRAAPSPTMTWPGAGRASPTPVLGLAGAGIWVLSLREYGCLP